MRYLLIILCFLTSCNFQEKGLDFNLSKGLEYDKDMRYTEAIKMFSLCLKVDSNNCKALRYRAEDFIKINDSNIIDSPLYEENRELYKQIKLMLSKNIYCE